MTDPIAEATTYLAPGEGSFWTWSEEGEALVWRDGPTIAFREEVEAALLSLAPRGLPPFVAVVLLLAACRDGWPDRVRPTVEAVADQLDRLSPEVRRELPPRRILQVFKGLTDVHRLPPAVRRGPEAKAALLETVLGDAPTRLEPDEALEVAGALPDAGVPRAAARTTAAPADFWLVQALEALGEGLGDLDPDALALRARTGLDRPVRAAPLDLPPRAPGQVRELLEELADDPELAGLTRLARHLMATVQVPRPLAAPDALPVGGYSDLAPRGPLDRLLTSELAHDDEVLAVRVALGEALYLRREAPPGPPAARRAVLLDAGIRLWGTGRVFATAVGLALAATAEPGEEVRVLRASGRSAVPVDLTRREDLVEHLETLEAAPSPVPALPAFLRATDPSGPRRPGDPGPDVRTERFLVTAPAVLEETGLRRALEADGPPDLHVATVDGRGRFRLVHLGPRGRHEVRRATLDLEAVLGPRPDVRVDAPADDLPVVFSTEPFPLLLPHRPPIERARFHPVHGVVAHVHDGRLLHWAEPERGARQLTDRAAGSLLSLRIGDGGTARAVLGTEGPGGRLVRADLGTGRTYQTDLDRLAPGTRTVLDEPGVLLAVGEERVGVLDPHDGRLIEVLGLPSSLRWTRERFFRGEDGWSALAWDGQTARLEPVPFARLPSPPVFLFDRSGLDGPWGVTEVGQVIGLTREGPTVQKVLPEVTGPVRVRAVSRDGHRLVVAREGPEAPLLLVELESGQVRELDASRGAGTGIGREARAFLEPAVIRHTRPKRRLRRRFRGAADHGGHLCLVDPSHRPLPLRVHEKSGQLVLDEPDDSGLLPARKRRTFAPIQGPEGTGYELKEAAWPDGSRVILDSRGLLHLQPASTDLPEVTLVLSHGPLVAWISDGRWAGSRYFVGERDRVDGAAVARAVQAFREGLP